MSDTTESVYNPNGGKLSELQWGLDRVLQIDLGLTVQPVEWLRLNVDYAMPIEDGDADMTDTDWFDPYGEWTHQSYHDDTVITKANQFDANAQFAVAAVGPVLFTAGLGYRIDDWEWEASGGTYVYSVDGFRDSVGEFQDSGPGVTYGYKYSSFYMSLGAQAEVSSFVFAGRVLYGPETSIETEDTHHQRGLIFTEDFDDTTMFSVELGAAWRFDERLTFYGDYAYTQYNEAKGPTTITDMYTGEQYLEAGSKGAIENNSNVFSIGVSYRF